MRQRLETEFRKTLARYDGEHVGPQQEAGDGAGVQSVIP